MTDDALQVPDSSPGIVVHMMMCDAAQVTAGKLFILGGGVSLIGPQVQPIAVAMQILVPWDRANIAHHWRLALVDEDGQQVMIGTKPVIAEGKFEAGRPAGLRPGSPLTMALAINLPAFPLAPDGAYEFRLSINDESRPDWKARFATRPAKT